MQALPSPFLVSNSNTCSANATHPDVKSGVHNIVSFNSSRLEVIDRLINDFNFYKFMNLKPTIYKNICSITTFIFFDVILSFYHVNSLRCAEEICPSVLSQTVNPGILFVSLFLGLLVYIIWSLIEKKK